MLFGRMRVVNHVKLFNLSSNESKCYIARQTTEVMEKFKRLYSVYPEAEREKQLFSFFFSYMFRTQGTLCQYLFTEPSQ